MEKNNTERFSPKRTVEELRKDVLAWIEKKPQEDNLEGLGKKEEPAKAKEVTVGGFWKFCASCLARQFKEWKKIKGFVLGAVTSVLIGIVLIILVVGVGLYKYQWDNGLVNLVIKIIPYPVALVNNQVLLYSEFRADVKTLDNFYAKQQEVVKDGLLATPPKEELRKNILDRMIKDKLVQAAVKNYGLKVTRKEVAAELTNIIGQAGSQEEVARTLEELYNWSVKDFQKRILYPYLLRQKLQKAIQEDENLGKPLKNLENYLTEQQKKATIYRFIEIK